MSGDVQPRKRKDKKKAKRDDEDIKVEHHHGVHETKMGKDDVHLHVHSDHGTGGHWCAKLLFFSLLAVLFGLVGIIILENRGSSDVDTPLSESRFSEYFDGWVDEHRQAHDDHRKTGLEDHDHDSPPFEEEEDHSEQDNEDEHDVTHEDSHDEEDDDDREEEPIQSNEDEGVSDNDEDDEDREEEDEEENETIEDNKNEDDDDEEEEADNYVERSYTRMKRDVDEVSDEGFDEAAGNIDDEDDEDNEIVENNENDNKDDDENDKRDEPTEPNETVQQTETIEEKDNDDDNNPGNDDEDRDDDDAPFEETSTNQKSALRSAEKQSETLIPNKVDAFEFAKNFDTLDSKTEAVPLIIEPNEIGSKLDKTEQSSKVQERQSLLDNKSNTESVRKADEKSIVDEQIVEKDAEEILKRNQNILQTSDESKAVDEEQHPQHIDKTATNEHGTTQESIKGSTDPGKDEHDQHQNVKIEDVSHDLVDDQDIAETTKEHADGSSENLVVVNKMEKNIRDENQSIQKKIEESEVGGSDPLRSQAGETDEVKNIEQLTDGDPGTKKQLRHDEKLEQQTQEESEKSQAEAVNKNPSLADDIATKESKQLAKDKEFAEKSSENNKDQDQSESVQELPKVSVPSTEEKIKQPEGEQKANENIEQSPKESQADLKKSGKDEDLSQEFTETKRSTRSASEHISGAKNKEDDDFDDEEQSLEQVVDNDAGEELHLRQKAEQEELAAKAAASQEEEESESAPQVRGPQSLMDDDAFLDEEIRRANEELFNDNLQSALRILESLIRKFPENPKALYGKAKVHDQLSAKYKNNQMLMDAIDAYRAVIKLDDKMDDAMFREVAERCLDRMRFKGMFAESVPIHRKLIRRFSNDPNVRNQLAVTYLLQNRYAEAKYMLHHTLMRWRDNGFAQAHYGFILKVHDNDLKNAVSLLREGIESEAEGTQDGRFYFALGDALYRLGEKDEAMQVYEKGAALKLFPSAYQRSLYNVNNLKAQPFWTPEETTYEKQLAILQRNWELIRKEGLSALGIQGLYTDEAENLRETGNWKQLELFARGLRIEKNCAKTPLVCNIIEVFPAARTCKRGQVKFSIMDPGTHVWPHCGPTNCRLRAHLGLVVPDGTRIRVASEERTWKAGEWLIFDDSFEHEVWHNGTSPRLVLIVDIWHPDLTKEQREGLSRI